MRAKTREAMGVLKQQLLRTGAIEPLVALFFADHIEQVQFEDPSILETFDVRTVRSFDYLRTVARLKKPQAALIALDVLMGPFESDELDVAADTTAILVLFDSPLLTIQAIAPYTRSNGKISIANVQFSEMPGDEGAVPCPLLRIFVDAPLLVT
jgi:hypothetical protein